MARFGGVHVFGYNYAKGKTIWMKSGARQSVMRWKLSEQNFENFTVMGHFSNNAKNSGKFLTFCNIRCPYLCTDYRSLEIHYQIIPLHDV